MEEPKIILELSKADAEVLLGVLAAERHNVDVDAVCQSLREQLDRKLGEPAQ
jgi:hypothetical protein